jgi:cytochrome P450 PksS
MLRDKRFTVDRRKAGFKPPLLQRWLARALDLEADSLVTVDDPEHNRLRVLVHQAFTPRTIDKLAGWIEDVTRQLLDAAARKDQVDLIADFALPLPLTVISEMLGVPEEQRLEFRALVSDLFKFSTAGANIVSMAVSGYRLRRYIGKLIDLRRRAPDDGLITALITAEASGDRLTEAELMLMVLLLLLAGHETTVNLIGNGMLALLHNPDQLEQLCSRPELAGQAVEECLRFAPPVEYGMPRHALADVQMGNVTIRRGDQVIALLSAANRDDSAFPNADRLDITREANRQITFGVGLHFCLGAPLARMEGTIAFRGLTQRFPNIALAVPQKDLEWWNIAGLRGLKELPVRLR